ncbi:MAG: hypothetical protein ABJH05_07415 [Fulvivirga sp.]
MKKTKLAILFFTLLFVSCHQIEFEKEKELTFNKVSLSQAEKESILNQLSTQNIIDESFDRDEIIIDRIDISGANATKEELNYAIEQNYNLNSKKVNLKNANCGIDCWCDREWIDVGDTGCVMSFCQCMNSSCNLRITTYIYCH